MTRTCKGGRIQEKRKSTGKGDKCVEGGTKQPKVTKIQTKYLIPQKKQNEGKKKKKKPNGPRSPERAKGQKP